MSMMRDVAKIWEGYSWLKEQHMQRLRGKNNLGKSREHEETGKKSLIFYVLQGMTPKPRQDSVKTP